MTRKLHISDDLSLPLDAVTQKLAFLGRTGGGKTYAAMKLAELMLDAGAQVVALDPVGIWHGLRLGDEPYDIPVFGGLHGDIPLEPSAGALIADVIVDRGISAVLDVSQMIGTEPARFATAFAERFFQRKKSASSAVHVFIEECQEFVPQNTTKGLGQERMLHEFQRLVKLGRNFGIGVSLISQRPQETNKKVLNQTECMFAFQMTAPQERRAIEAWVQDKGFDEDVGGILPKLKIGRAHVWSPQWLEFRGVVAIGKKRTADVSSTPKVGAGARAQAKLSPVDLSRLEKDMEASIKRAKAEDPKELRAEVARLKAELAKKPAAAKPERVEVPIVDREGLDTAKADLARIGTCIAELAVAHKGALAENEAMEKRVRSAAALGERGVSRPVPPPVDWAARFSKPRSNGVPADPEVGRGGLRRILVSLAQRPDGLTQRQIGVRAGLSSRSGTFSNYLSRARTAAWVMTRPDGNLVITEPGLAALGAYEPLPTGRDLLEHWLRELGESGAARMLSAVAAAYPNTLTKAEIGEAAGISPESGTFSNYLSKLRSLELIEGHGELRASEELFG